MNKKFLCTIAVIGLAALALSQFVEIEITEIDEEAEA